MAKDTGKGAAGPAKIDTTNWESEQVGFDPYFVIAPGASFVASFLGRDDTNEDFIRYQFMAAEDMVCQRGPNKVKTERTEMVDVKAGETFNISKFEALGKLLDQYINYSEDTGKAVVMKVTSTEKIVTQSGNDVWLWKVAVPSNVKAELNEWRKGHMPKALRAGAEARAQLAQ